MPDDPIDARDLIQSGDWIRLEFWSVFWPIFAAVWAATATLTAIMLLALLAGMTNSDATAPPSPTSSTEAHL